jgi:5-methylcytosine-specific restriction endonuclease McrA
VSGPDPKPRKRVVNPDAGVGKLRQERACRVCGQRTMLLERHHLVKRSQGGDDVDENIVPLCGDGVAGCHGRVEAKHRETLVALRKALRPDELDYIILRKGEAWLDRMYPRTTLRAVRPK